MPSTGSQLSDNGVQSRKIFLEDVAALLPHFYGRPGLLPHLYFAHCPKPENDLQMVAIL